jgi:hypothetical protein
VPACISSKLLVTPIALLAFTLMVNGLAIAKPATLCVNPGGTAGCFSKIQDAVDATGKSGSVINVALGAYFDNVIVPKIKLTINADPDTAIFGNTSDPILTIAAGAKVTINNLQFQDTFTTSSCISSRGSLTMQNIAVFLCAGKRGAAIHQVGGKLTIVSSTFSGNQASENGGCLAMEGGKLSLQGTDFTNCIADGDGGAIWLSNTKANIVGIKGEAHEPSLIITSNQASGSGGGVFASGGKLTIEAVRIENNSAVAGDGGGINSMASLTVSNSNIVNNSASGDGGGILAQGPGKFSLINSGVTDNFSQSDGGGIAADTTFDLLNDTFFDNHADKNGGAVSARASGEINSLTIDLNDSFANGGGLDVASGTVKIANTIIGPDAATSSGPDCAGSVVSQGFNLIFSTSGCSISGQTATNITGEAPGLGPLEHFDVKFVQEPNQGSPVLGAGGHCPRTDEVLHPRSKNRCDIGAFEEP